LSLGGREVLPMAKKRLGIDALFKTSVPAAEPAPAAAPADVEVAVERLRPSPAQPRAHFDDRALADLTESIRAHGVLQPLLVRTASEGAFEIVAGERRWRAAKAAGLSTVPVRVLAIDEQGSLAVAMVENLQREDLNPLEEAEGYLELLRLRLADEPGFSPLGSDEDPKQAVIRLLRALNNRSAGNTKDNVVLTLEPAIAEVFSRVGRIAWPSFVAHRLPLLSLPDDVRAAVRSGRLEYTKARLIARVTAERLEGDDARARRMRRDLIEQATTEGLSVRGLQIEVAQALGRKEPAGAPALETAGAPEPSGLQAKVETLRARLGELDADRYDAERRDALEQKVDELLQALEAER
jgi:ParB family transcriptional regulator, chromosome partitioning protein